MKFKYHIIQLVIIIVLYIIFHLSIIFILTLNQIELWDNWLF